MAISYESNYSPLAVIISVSLFSRVLGLRHSVIVGDLGEVILNESESTASVESKIQVVSTPYKAELLAQNHAVDGDRWNWLGKGAVHCSRILESSQLVASLTQLRSYIHTRAKSSLTDQTWILIFGVLLITSCTCCILQRWLMLYEDWHDDDASGSESDGCKNQLTTTRKRDKVGRLLERIGLKSKHEGGVSDDSYHSDNATIPKKSREEVFKQS
mmetsp:Transcript_119989/g.188238  ORF Transcript_119989/g.188238 Transcript_119989/m.188238 type:complete len:215 (-) Transcript_119989:64-708(-)